MTSTQAFNIADCARQRFCLTFLGNDGRCEREAESYLLIERFSYALLLAELIASQAQQGASGSIA
jgi:hypothetical protein